MIGDIWYRLIDVHYAPPLDEWDREMGRGEIRVHLETYKVIKETPKGVWLCRNFLGCDLSGMRFVLRDSRKRFACPTKEEAIESFRARKKAQIKIYTARLESAHRALGELERGRVVGDK